MTSVHQDTVGYAAGDPATPAADAILSGRTYLGIELGSSRIKACLVGENPSMVYGVGVHDWRNEFVDQLWTYSLDSIWTGLRAAYADLVDTLNQRFGVSPATFGGIGISAMMHGYLALDRNDNLLTPFRTWRNATTGVAASELTTLFGVNIPHRWSIAHLHQAVLDREPHVSRIAHITTLAGYVHSCLTGRKVIGVGDASGMFPIDTTSKTFDAELLARYEAHLSSGPEPRRLEVNRMLPEVLVAGTPAGVLTADGAALIDPTGALLPGARFCPPEGDAGTGMVSTFSVAPRTGNVSAGTSIFAMVVLDHPLDNIHPEIDIVTTPSGDPVAMVHCNNGASELQAWAELFHGFVAATGNHTSIDEVFDLLFREAMKGSPDAGGLLAYNHVAAEPIAGLTEGRPLFVRTPESEFTLANFARSQIYGVFATLALGMRALRTQGVQMDRMFAHGGLFRSTTAARRLLAAALDAPVSTMESASEGGAWGIAVLASFAFESQPEQDLDDYLLSRVFGSATFDTTEQDPADTAGFVEYLEQYRNGLDIERTAITSLPLNMAG